MAYAILPALMLCMHRFFNKINNIQILLHNIRISLHVGNTHPIIVSAINNKSSPSAHPPEILESLSRTICDYRSYSPDGFQNISPVLFDDMYLQFI